MKLVSFDESAYFSSIPVPVALEVIKEKFTEHIEEKGMGHFLKKTCLIYKDNVISLLELVLNNYLSFPREVLQTALRCSSAFSSVIYHCKHVHGIHESLQNVPYLAHGGNICG